MGWTRSPDLPGDSVWHSNALDCLAGQGRCRPESPRRAGGVRSCGLSPLGALTSQGGPMASGPTVSMATAEWHALPGRSRPRAPGGPTHEPLFLNMFPK